MSITDNPRTDALYRILILVIPVITFAISPVLFLALYAFPLALFAVLFLMDIFGQLILGTEILKDSALGAFLLFPYSSILYALTGNADFLEGIQ